MENTLTPANIKQIKLNTGGAKTMSFPDATKEIIKGKKVARVSWGNGDYGFLDGEWLSIFTNNKVSIWKVNDGDMFGEDWIVVEEVN